MSGEKREVVSSRIGAGKGWENSWVKKMRWEREKPYLEINQTLVSNRIHHSSKLVDRPPSKIPESNYI